MFREIIGRVARSMWRLSMLGLPAGEHIARYSMYKSIQGSAKGLNFGDRVLSISHSEHLCRLVGIPDKDIIAANYPQQNICALDVPSESVTAVISDQVFEHISCVPNRAVDECYRVLAPGGIAIHTTCFMLPYHGAADYNNSNNGDYWRYTPSGLRLLHQNYSKVICAEGWGNPFMTVVGGLGLTLMPVPELAWHPLNKFARLRWPSYDSVVWVIAQK